MRGESGNSVEKIVKVRGLCCKVVHNDSSASKRRRPNSLFFSCILISVVVLAQRRMLDLERLAGDLEQDARD